MSSELKTYYGIFQDIARGLMYLHRKGIVHRDLKPANILSVRNKSDCLCFKLSDFGLARIVDQEMTSHVGTVLYMSPEQHSTKYTQSTDIYSFGLIMLEVLYPMRRSQKFQCISELKHPPYQLPAVFFNGKLPSDIGLLIKQMVEEHPILRPTLETVLKIVNELIENANDEGSRERKKE